MKRKIGKWCGLIAAVFMTYLYAGGLPFSSTIWAACYRTTYAPCTATGCSAFDWSCARNYNCSNVVTPPIKPWVVTGSGQDGSTTSGYCKWQATYVDCWGTLETCDCERTEDQGQGPWGNPCST